MKRYEIVSVSYAGTSVWEIEATSAADARRKAQTYASSGVKIVGVRKIGDAQKTI